LLPAKFLIWLLALEKNIKRDRNADVDTESASQICSEAKNIWHAIYGVYSNSSYWLLGGSVGCDTKDKSCDPLSSAIRHKLGEYREEESETNKMMEKFDNDNYHLDQMTHLYLTREASEVLGELLEMYSYVEAMFYSVRRYDDELRQSYHNLDALLSSIYGQFYNIFRGSSIVAHCYLIADIEKLLIKNDTFETVLKSQHLQHHMRFMECRNISELVTLHKELHGAVVPDKNGRACPDLNSCVLTFLKLSGRRFHSDYAFKALKESLGEKGNNIDWTTAGVVFENCKKLHDQNEKEGQVHYEENSDFSHMAAIHGYCYQKPEKNTIKKEKKKSVKKGKK